MRERHEEERCRKITRETKNADIISTIVHASEIYTALNSHGNTVFYGYCIVL